MSKEQAIRKINKVGQIGQIITRILTILFSCIGGICFVALIMLLVLPNAYFPTITTKTITTAAIDLNQLVTEEDIEEFQKDMVTELTISGVSLDADGYTIEDGIMIQTDDSTRTVDSYKMLMVSMIYCVITIIATIISTVFLGKLLKSFRYCESPFSYDVIRNMKHFSFSLIPWAVISSLSGSSFTVMSGLNDSITPTVNVSILIAVLLLLVLSYIFQYGAVLQQESDETL